MSRLWSLTMACSGCIIACSSNGNMGAGSGDVTNPDTGSFNVEATELSCPPMTSCSTGVVGGGTGHASVACTAAPSVALFGSSLIVSCASDGGEGPDSTIVLTLAKYHGTDTYTFQGQTSEHGGSNGPAFQLMVGDYLFENASKEGPQVATTCKVMLTGAAALTQGDEVHGSIQCDSLVGTAVYADSSYTPPAYLSVRGSFSAASAF